MHGTWFTPRISQSAIKDRSPERKVDGLFVTHIVKVPAVNHVSHFYQVHLLLKWTTRMPFIYEFKRLLSITSCLPATVLGKHVILEEITVSGRRRIRIRWVSCTAVSLKSGKIIGCCGSTEKASPALLRLGVWGKVTMIPGEVDSWRREGWGWRSMDPQNPAHSGCPPRLGLNLLLSDSFFAWRQMAGSRGEREYRRGGWGDSDVLGHWPLSAHSKCLLPSEIMSKREDAQEVPVTCTHMGGNAPAKEAHPAKQCRHLPRLPRKFSAVPGTCHLYSPGLKQGGPGCSSIPCCCHGNILAFLKIIVFLHNWMFQKLCFYSYYV